jgi:hypothetical protein
MGFEAWRKGLRKQAWMQRLRRFLCWFINFQGLFKRKVGASDKTRTPWVSVKLYWAAGEIGSLNELKSGTFWTKDDVSSLNGSTLWSVARAWGREGNLEILTTLEGSEQVQVLFKIPWISRDLHKELLFFFRPSWRGWNLQQLSIPLENSLEIASKTSFENNSFNPNINPL